MSSEVQQRREIDGGHVCAGGMHDDPVGTACPFRFGDRFLGVKS